MNIDKRCKGCRLTEMMELAGPEACVFFYHRRIDKCPCTSCIVKPTCRITMEPTCSERNNLLDIFIKEIIYGTL